MGKDKRNVLKMLFASALLVVLSSVVVHAKEYKNIEQLTPKTLISVGQVAKYDYENVDRTAYPERTDGRFYKWSERVKGSFSDYVACFEEAADNDGIRDFLIDPYISDGVQNISFVEENEVGKEYTINALAYKLGTVSAASEEETTGYETFMLNYDKEANSCFLAYEAFMNDHSEVFWLSESITLCMPEYMYWYDENSGQWKYEGDFYLLLHCDEDNYDIRHPKYWDANILKETIVELNERIEKILEPVNGKDHAAKIIYFNQWLIEHNEPSLKVSDELDDYLTGNPDIYTCLSALRGSSGENAPLSSSYTRAFNVLCKRSDILCTLETGNYIDVNVYHEWNIVGLNNEWFVVDVANNALITVYDELNIQPVLLAGGSSDLVPDEGLTVSPCYMGDNISEYLEGYALQNRPIISHYPYKSIIKSISLSSSDECVMVGFEENAIISADIEFNGDYLANAECKWSYDKLQDGKIEYLSLEGEKSQVELPSNLKPGFYNIRLEVSLWGRVLCADIKLELAEFEDVSKDEYFYPAVDWAIDHGVTSGYTKYQFASKMPCTRGQVVTFLWRAAGCPEPETTDLFYKDVNKDSYYAKAVLWAVENKIAYGYTDEIFAPEDAVTRAQFVSFLWRREGSPDFVIDEVEYLFEDVHKDDYYYDAVYWAVSKGITYGYTYAIFAPDVSALRCEVITFIWRADK